MFYINPFSILLFMNNIRKYGIYYDWRNEFAWFDFTRRLSKRAVSQPGLKVEASSLIILCLIGSNISKLRFYHLFHDVVHKQHSQKMTL